MCVRNCVSDLFQCRKCWEWVSAKGCSREWVSEATKVGFHFEFYRRAIHFTPPVLVSWFSSLFPRSFPRPPRRCYRITEHPRSVKGIPRVTACLYPFWQDRHDHAEQLRRALHHV